MTHSSRFGLSGSFVGTNEPPLKLCLIAYPERSRRADRRPARRQAGLSSRILFRRGIEVVVGGVATLYLESRFGFEALQSASAGGSPPLV